MKNYTEDEGCLENLTRAFGYAAASLFVAGTVVWGITKYCSNHASQDTQNRAEQVKSSVTIGSTNGNLLFRSPAHKLYNELTSARESYRKEENLAKLMALQDAKRLEMEIKEQEEADLREQEEATFYQKRDENMMDLLERSKDAEEDERIFKEAQAQKYTPSQRAMIERARKARDYGNQLNTLQSTQAK